MKITTHKAAQGRGKSMFLRHSLLRQSVTAAVFAAFTLLSPSAFATAYEITSTDDSLTPPVDGVCTLREAVTAINTQVDVDSCLAGTGTDTLLLLEAAEYPLVGELVLGGGMSSATPPANINPRVTVKVIPDGVFDKSIKENPTLYASQNARIFVVKSGASLIIDNTTLDGKPPGVATTGPTDGFGGGLIYSEGGLAVTGHTILQNGVTSLDGGAVYLAADNLVFSIDNAAFIGNSATASGGAIATVSTFSGLIGGQFFYFANNTAGAEGGGIFVNGAGPALLLENGTFYGNSAADGGAIRLAAPERVVGLNNVTIAGQNGGGGISFAAEAAADSLFDEMRNSVIVGNVGGSCVGDSVAIDGAYLAYVLNEGGSCPNDQTGFVQTGPGPGDNIANDEDAAGFSVLAGVDSTGADISSCPFGASGSADCAPREFEGSWPGFLPSLVDAIGVNDGVPTAINSASPFGSTSNPCATLDQRAKGRDDDCDAGAIELTAAQGNIDEFFVVVGTRSELDVLANDLGDATVECACGVTGGLEVLIQARKGTVSSGCDANNQSVMIYQSFEGVHGVDRFSYRLPSTCVTGGLTRGGSDVGALANVVVEPASGLLKSDGIGGVMSWLVLFVVVMAGVARRMGLRAVFTVCMLVVATASQAATITVTGLDDNDPSVTTDGICTLREAIANASSPTSSDCVFGDASSTDTILLPEGTITLSAPLQIPARSLIDIIGKGADVNLPTSSIIDGGGAHRILSSLSRLKLTDLVLQNGLTTDRGAAVYTNASLTLERVALLNNSAASGGAIFLSFNSEEQRTFSVKASEFDGNTASLSGAAVSMVAQNQVHSLKIESTSFVNNDAGIAGGALDVNLPKGGSLSVANATFYNNTAASGGGAIDLQDAISTITILNSTFVDNGTYGLDLGNIDPAVVGVRMYNSVYFDSATNSALCSSGTGFFSAEDYNVFGMRPAAPSSCHQSTASANSRDRDSGELSTLLGVIPVPAAGAGDAFVPTYFAISAADTNAAYLVDAGNGVPGELATGFAQPWAKCRTVDTRGAARTSGGQCDIGAYELKVATSVDDKGANTSRTGSYAIIDVVANDVAGETGFIVPYAIDLDPTGLAGVQTSGAGTVPVGIDASLGSVRLVGNTTLESLDEDCGWDPRMRPEGGFDGCFVRYEPPTFTLCSEIKDFTDTFTYAAIFNNQEDLQGLVDSTSLPGTVTISVSNRPPSAPNITVASSPGSVVVFPFKIVDPEVNIAFGSEDGPEDHEYEVKAAPINAKYNVVDQERVYLGVGIIIDPVAQTLTYIPDSVSSPFNERFSIGYKDACGATGTTVFEIKYPDGQASGDVLGGGSIGSVAWLFILLLLGRRRL